MHIIKKLARVLSSYLFKLFIFLVAIVAALVFTFHSPKKIEKSLTDSGAYNTFIDSALQEANKSNKDSKDSNNIPINNPAIKSAANKAFSPELLKSSTENVLNGVYDWLAGKTTIPDFKVDLRPAKKTFAQGVGEAAKQRLALLPVCTAAQLQKLSSDIDSFSVPCRPPGINLDAQQKKVTHDIATSKDFLGTPLLTAQTMPKNDRGKTVFDQLAKAPKVYKLVNASPWLLGGLAVLFGILTVVLYDQRRRGLRHISIILVSTGVLLLIISLVSNWLLNRANRPGGKLGEAVKGGFQQTAIKAISSINSSFEHIIIWFGAIYILIGVTTLVVLHFTKPKTQPTEHKKEELKTNQASKAEIEKPPSKEK